MRSEMECGAVVSSSLHTRYPLSDSAASFDMVCMVVTRKIVLN